MLKVYETKQIYPVKCETISQGRDEPNRPDRLNKRNQRNQEVIKMKKIKMVDIYFDAGFEDVVIERLEKMGINAYYKFPKVLGKTPQSEPKLDEHIWPGYFILIRFKIDDTKIKDALPALKKMEESYKDKGFEIYITDAFV